MPEIHSEQLPNGLHLLAEPIAGAQSLSMTLLLPGGSMYEPSDQFGVAPMLSEIICRGAGGLDARQHSEALERLGVHRSTNTETRHLRLSATMLGDKVDEALPLLVDMVRRPRFDEASLEPTRLLALQSLDALADEPQQRVMLELKRRFYPEPINRSPLGVREHLQAMTLDQIKSYWQRTFVPSGAILAFAGKLDWSALRDRVAKLTADWQGAIDEPIVQAEAKRDYEHMQADTSQVHIGMAYDAVPENGESSILQRAATSVLSGGMSGRLFTEVREKRGLCYAVMASYSGHRDRGAVLGYAGTTTPRAQETLDVMVQEHRRMSEGVDESEFQRAIVGLKSRLVMQGESTGARAGAIAFDQYNLGRPRTLEELAEQVDGVTLEKVNAFMREHKPGEMTVVTLGSQALRF
ncbi:M16 family metallopeptidase [Phycisphaerales bacterium AB-hyl4]|uniref:M16 family metallopeptidase n=1 Tax=Natronomicrosphaera hydrolytica TaxID=3242702 RepID=A0ABV4UB11_9BACT